LNVFGPTFSTWLGRYWASRRSDIQILSAAKRDDMAHTIDQSKRVFVFNVTRGQMEFLQYSVLEAIKDQMVFVFSPKYMSYMKIIPHKTHVIVSSNEPPDYQMLSNDKYNVINVSN
jgi:hypothetical protein